MVQIALYGLDENMRMKKTLIPLSELQKFTDAQIFLVSLEVEHDGMKLVADTDAREEEYRGITIAGYAHNRDYNLASVELPGGMCPDSFTSMLYAGCTEYESDEPIACVKSSVEWLEPGCSLLEPPEVTKCVYVEESVAVPLKWDNRVHMLKEHLEDDPVKP